MVRFFLAAVVIAGCGGSQQPEPAPPYTPANTPEAATTCPDEAAAAKAAREAALEDETLHGGEQAAGAVFALAECERRAFDAVELGSPEDPTVIEELKIHFQNAKNYYAEVANYRAPRWVIGAHTRVGDLHAAFGAKLRAMTPASGAPPDLWAKDMAVLDEHLMMEAGHAYRDALDGSVAWPNLAVDDAEVRAWLQASCQGLARVDAVGAQRYAACAR